MRLGVQITDLDMLKRTCEESGVEYRDVTAENQRGRSGPIVAYLIDRKSKQSAYLTREKDGSHRIYTDSAYTQDAKMGKKLSRDYTAGTAIIGVKRAGGRVTSKQELPDGSLILKVQAM